MNLRKRKFYGKSILEGIQAPGETVYVPHFTPHSVYNLDDVVSLSDNPYYSTAVEESANLLFHTKFNHFARLNGSDVLVYQGIVKNFIIPNAYFIIKFS